MKLKICFAGLMVLLALTSCSAVSGYSADIRDPKAFENSYWMVKNSRLVRSDRNFEKIKNPADVILKLNKRFQKDYSVNPPQLIFQKLKSNALYLKLENAEYVTKKMSAADAKSFMAVATFTLTEIEGVQNVFFEFKGGDNARPGNYMRSNDGVFALHPDTHTPDNLTFKLDLDSVMPLDVKVLEKNENFQTTFYDENKKLFVSIYQNEPDWFEDLYIGTVKNNQIHWLDISEIPDEQAIFSVKFVHVKGFSNPLVEVYGIDHRGNGKFYLYEIKADEVIKLLSAQGYDINHEYNEDQENLKKYGYLICSELFQNDRLLAEYKDFNHDGMTDLVLQGNIDVVCEKSWYPESSEIKITSFPVTNYFVWNAQKHRFIETTQP